MMYRGSLPALIEVVPRRRTNVAEPGVPEELAKEAIRLAQHKLPIKTKFVKKEDTIGGEANES